MKVLEILFVPVLAILLSGTSFAEVFLPEPPVEIDISNSSFEVLGTDKFRINNISVPGRPLNFQVDFIWNPNQLNFEPAIILPVYDGVDNSLMHTDLQASTMLTEKYTFIPHRVAHAGGGINSRTYTNSYEALNSNLKKGFLYFELDFSFTKDGELVCLHDWGPVFRRYFGFKPDESLTIKDFKLLVDEKSEFTNCTIDGLAAWMTDNTSAFIITDIKADNVRGLKMIYAALPDAKNRVIPQIYDPNNFEMIKKIGFEKIIWTLYRFRGINEEVINWVNKFHGPFAITMTKGRAESTLPKELKKLNIPTYVHTINSIQEFNKYILEFEAAEIYTDFIRP